MQPLGRESGGYYTRIGWIACLFILLAGCETTVSTKFSEDASPAAPVRLSSGDVVRITFPGTTELTQSQTIQTDGKINLPYIGEVQASGRTVGDLQRELEARYESELQDTTVVLTLEKSVTAVVVGGAVKNGGKYAFDRPTTVLQAIMEAGGTDTFGTLGKVSLIRLVNGQQRTQLLDLRPILHGRPTRPVYVHTGDIVLVGESVF